jgi:hypothetical protein
MPGLEQTVILERGTGVPDRPFTAPALTDGDLAALVGMRAALRRRTAAGAGAGTWEEAGEQHLLVAPRLDALVVRAPAVAVGFFGQTRDHVDHAPILRLEYALLARAGTFAALVSYHNVRFADGRWGNLVSFADDDGRADVRDDPLHREALARTAVHYRSVRLHRLRLADGAAGTAAPELRETLLLDFDESPPWRAIRGG